MAYVMEQTRDGCRVNFLVKSYAAKLNATRR